MLVHVFPIIFFINLYGQSNGFNFLPTVSLDPRNALFQCNDPTISVGSSDAISLLCMGKHGHNYKATEQKSPRKIQIYLTTDENVYQTCSYKRASLALTCDKTNPEVKCPDGINCTGTYDLSSAIPSGKFTPKRGVTYYLFAIYNEELAIDKLSPCLGNNDNFPRPIKFKIYFCTEEETNAGLCKTCNYEACYFAQCHETCGNWQDKNSSKILYDKKDICYKQQIQKCLNNVSNLISINVRDTKIPCPKPECGPWSASEIIDYQAGECFKESKRSCVNFRGESSIENKKDNITCPTKKCTTSWTLAEKKTAYMDDGTKCFKKYHKYCNFVQTGKVPQLFQETLEKNVSCPTATTPSTSEVSTADNKDLNIKIAIGASVAAFVFGIFVGFCIFKCLQSRIKQVEVVKTVEKLVPVEGLGPTITYDNKQYNLDPVLEGGVTPTFSIADVELVPAIQQVGTLKREVIVARSASFYNEEEATGHLNIRESRLIESNNYRPSGNSKESNRNVMRHPSAASRTVLIRPHSEVSERARSYSDISGVYYLRQPEDSVSEEV